MKNDSSFRSVLLKGLGSALLFVLISAGSAMGQIQRTVGFHVGQAQSRQIWDDPFASARASGPSLGVNVDVPTPFPHLSVRVGVGYVRRGSVVRDQTQGSGEETAARVRSHYLSFPFQGKLVFRLGAGALYFFGGPTIDQLLETECSQELCRVLQDEVPTVLAFSAGSGISFEIGRRLRLDLEGQLTEAVMDGYRSSLSGIRYRTFEFIFRAGFPF